MVLQTLSCCNVSGWGAVFGWFLGAGHTSLSSSSFAVAVCLGARRGPEAVLLFEVTIACHAQRCCSGLQVVPGAVGPSCGTSVTPLLLFLFSQACKVQSSPGLPSLARCGSPACPLLVSPHPPLRNLPIGVSHIPPSFPIFAPFCRVCFFPISPAVDNEPPAESFTKRCNIVLKEQKEKKKKKQDLHCTPLGSLQWWVGQHQLRACWDVGLSGIHEGSALCRPMERGRKGKCCLPRSFGASRT